MSGILIKIEPNGKREIHEYKHKGPPTWEILHQLVGGYIERVRVRYEGKLRDAYMDEEGLIKSPPLAPNPYALKLIADAYDRVPDQLFMGPIVIWLPDKKIKKNV